MFKSKWLIWLILNKKGKETSHMLLQKLQWPAEIPKIQLEHIHSSKNYVFAIIVNSLKSMFFFFTKNSLWDVWQGCESASGLS